MYLLVGLLSISLNETGRILKQGVTSDNFHHCPLHNLAAQRMLWEGEG